MRLKPGGRDHHAEHGKPLVGLEAHGRSHGAADLIGRQIAVAQLYQHVEVMGPMRPDDTDRQFVQQRPVCLADPVRDRPETVDLKPIRRAATSPVGVHEGACNIAASFHESLTFAADDVQSLTMLGKMAIEFPASALLIRRDVLCRSSWTNRYQMRQRPLLFRHDGF